MYNFRNETKYQKKLWKNYRLFFRNLRQRLKDDVKNGSGNTVDFLNLYLPHTRKIKGPRYNKSIKYLVHILIAFDVYHQTAYSDWFADYYINKILKEC